MTDDDGMTPPPRSPAKTWALRIGLGIAIVLLALSFVNASWLAGRQDGSVKLVANTGVTPALAKGASSACDAAHIARTGQRLILPMTVESALITSRAGAAMLAFDVHLTNDGVAVAFPDETLDCRTNGTGAVSAKSLAELQALDLGHGYSTDGGRTFPWRGGRFVGALPTLGAIAESVRNRRMLMRLHGDNPQIADAAVAALRGQKIALDYRRIFWAMPKVAARLRALSPESQVLVPAEIRQCTSDYAVQGWLGLTPASCANSALYVPMDAQWKVAGWPNRTAVRMGNVNAAILLAEDWPQGGLPTGLTRVARLGDVPRDFTGYLIVDKVLDIAPALN